MDQSNRIEFCCAECGNKHGRAKHNGAITMHAGKCFICKKIKSVSTSNHWGIYNSQIYPEYFVVKTNNDEEEQK